MADAIDLTIPGPARAALADLYVAARIAESKYQAGYAHTCRALGLDPADPTLDLNLDTGRFTRPADPDAPQEG